MAVSRTDVAADAEGGVARVGPKEAGRREVLTAAARAFRANGVEGTTIDDIADELGATKGRVYHYYRSKNAVLLDIHVSAMELVLAEVSPAATTPGPARSRLADMVRRTVTLNDRELDLLYVVISALFNGLPMSGRPPERAVADRVRELRREFEDLFVSVIDDGIRSGEFRNVDSRLVARALLGSMQWTVLWLGSTDRPITEVAAEMADYLLTGLVR
jgi:AcrR family transcriptional regulator